MRMLIPIGLITITAIPLMALTAPEAVEHEAETVVTRTFEIGDGENGFGFSIDAHTSMSMDEDDLSPDMVRMLTDLMKMGQGSQDAELDDRDQMMFAASMQDDRDRPRNKGDRDNRRNNRGDNRGDDRGDKRGDNRDHNDRNRDHRDRNQGDDRGRVIELDLGELTDGQLSGHIVIDLNSMMARGMGHNGGDMRHEVDVEMIVEDENGRRHVVRRSNEGDHGDRRMSPRGGPNGGPMDGVMMFRSDDHSMMHPPGAMAMPGMHGGPMEGMAVFGPTSPMGMPGMDEHMMRTMMMQMHGMDEHDMHDMMEHRMHWMEDDHHEPDWEEEAHRMREMLGHVHGMMEHQSHLLEDNHLDEGEIEQMRHHMERWRRFMDDRDHHDHEGHHEDRHHDHEGHHEDRHHDQEGHHEDRHHDHEGRHEDHHDDHDDHWDHRRELEAHLHELEMFLGDEHEEMDERERHDLMEEMDHIRRELESMHDHDRHEHDQHHDDGNGYFDQAEEFVHKIHMAEAMGDALSNQQAVAIFSIWMARQHLEPQAQVDMLSSIMNDATMHTSVRNAATWVVMEALAHMDRQDDAQATLGELIRRNGSAGN